ncbi:CPBP family intramembrane glutamic endopeptidase [Actinomyces sp. 565]|uniref:CPBP family intramembrane glutamic endopeptidase n=1 Tax=Actinomyces sp. 565 TaxID=2057794 RepID=UPI0013A6E1BF|nr:CPBP family intramembrane glutamic endopeptidase [Actinomyces sp. 565]NDR53164.1 CPBP family intramembrane metalloprotease [Actinomyces sp. 565]
MPKTDIARTALKSALLYILAMGIANLTVRHLFNTSYNDPGYARAMLPFFCLLALGAVGCFLALRKQLPAPTGPRSYTLFLVIFVPVVGMAAYYLLTNGQLSAAFMTPLAVAFLVGLAEEIMFRRVLYTAYLGEPNGRRVNGALLVSATMFSLLHAVNILAGQPLTGTLSQLVSTFIAGLFYALMYDYTKSIGLLVTAHFLWDYILLSDAPVKIPAISIAMGALTVVEFVITLVLILKRRKQEAIAPSQSA